jgi:hypothetical protein
MKYFEKTAFDLNNATKVLKLTKSLQIPKHHPQRFFDRSYGSMIDGVFDLQNEYGKNAIIVTPPKGDAATFLKIKGLNPNERKMLDSVIKGHELDEIVDMRRNGISS